MSKAALNQVLTELPTDLRVEIEGYVSSVEQASGEIFRTAGIAFDNALFDEFIFVVGIRRLWSLVNSLYWTLNTSLSLLREEEIDGIRVGSNVLSFASSDYQGLARVRSAMAQLLARSELQGLISIPLVDLLRVLREDGPRRLPS